jgi:hypothetical protein
MNSGVYSLRNAISGEEYIGGSADLMARRETHMVRLKSGKHPSKRVRESAKKHGIDAFVFEVIEPCDPSVLADREAAWIADRNPALNKRILNPPRWKPGVAKPVELRPGADGLLVNLIKQSAHSRGWNLLRLSRESGVGYRAIHDWLSDKGAGTRGPSVENVEKIMVALGLTVADVTPTRRKREK